MKKTTSKINVLFVIGTIVLTACGPKEAQVTELAPPKKVDTTKIVNSTPAAVKKALGIDVSHFQGSINWDEIKAHNIFFAYSKATEGSQYTDPKFKQNWSEMLTADLVRGAYHFYSTESSGEAQAQHFINTVKEIQKGDLPPVLDLEQGGLNGKVAVAVYQKEVMQWLNTVENHFGVKPIIYTNNPFANEYLNAPHFANYVLWVAEYRVEEAKTPLAWKDKGWAIWQRTESGNIQGEVGNVDHDITKVALHELLVK